MAVGPFFSSRKMQYMCTIYQIFSNFFCWVVMGQVPNLFCIGDANGKMMLAHAASAQGISGMSMAPKCAIPVAQINSNNVF